MFRVIFKCIRLCLLEMLFVSIKVPKRSVPKLVQYVSTWSVLKLTLCDVMSVSSSLCSLHQQHADLSPCWPTPCDRIKSSMYSYILTVIICGESTHNSSMLIKWKMKSYNRSFFQSYFEFTHFVRQNLYFSFIQLAAYIPHTVHIIIWKLFFFFYHPLTLVSLLEAF